MVDFDDWLVRTTDALAKDYAKTQFDNYGRSIDVKQAREELLSAGKMYSYVVGSTKPVSIYTDLERTTTYPNLFIFDQSGFPPDRTFLPIDGCDLRFVDSSDREIARISVGGSTL